MAQMKKGDKDPPIAPQPPKAEDAPRPKPAVPPVDLDQIRKEILERPQDSNVLLNIPIWGWEGDGKTCALLTAIHYCDPLQHPFEFALVRDPDDLNLVEESVEAYRGQHLASIAAASTQRLTELSKGFIDDCEWPPGTDEPSAYILAVKSVASTIGYVVFPDIKGGSFRELDETAREVLRKAHAAIVLVKPDQYEQPSTEGKRYRDEILDRLQRFGEAGVPVCLMMTKADRHRDQPSAADATSNSLAMIVERLKSRSSSLVTRVSVVGMDVQMVDDKLPPAEERHPDQLVTAFVWTVAEALKKPPVDSRKLLLSVNIRAIADRPAAVAATQVPELRTIGDYSDSPGKTLCPTADDAGSTSFALVSDSGEILEAVVRFSSGDNPAFKSIGNIPEWDGSQESQAYYAGGEFVVGAKTKSNFLWQGAKGGPLTKTPLPFEMAAWSAVSSRRLVGLDASGRLHAFRFDGGRWHQTAYLEGFISPAPGLACAYVEHLNEVFAFNGAAVEGVVLDPDGHFAARVSPALQCKYDTGRVATNRLGLCVAVTKAGTAVTSASTKPIDLGPTKPDAAATIALAQGRHLVAVVGPDLRLTASLVIGAEVRRSIANYSPVLPAIPSSLTWSPRGEVLVATFADRTWALFKPFGMGSY